MKRIMFLAVGLMALSCSDDDSKKETCNCQKLTAIYNENLEAYETTGSEYYSDDCSDETEVFNPNGDGTYYRINCTPQD